MTTISRSDTAERYGDKERFLKTFNPSEQARFCATPARRERCVIGTAPTLEQLSETYGNGASEAWLVPQLLNLSEFCGCKGKLSREQIEETARMIASDNPHRKVTELMLFFFWFKQGRYGKFYGSVDPMVIMEALNEFVLHDINAILADYYDRIDKEERERRRANSERNAVSYEEYRALSKTKGGR